MNSSAPIPSAASLSNQPAAGRPHPTTGTSAAPRLVSLDALRGFDMFWILGADALMHALGKVIHLSPMRALDGQFEHNDWAGFAFYDLIFPLFVFIVGVSLVFSLSRAVEQHGRAGAIKRVLFRATLLFLFGIFYAGGLTNPWPGIRVLGVLQRIALAYAATGLLFCFFKPRALAAIGIALLAGYWALLTFVPIRDIQLEKGALAVRLGDPKPTMEQTYKAFDATTTRVTGHYEPGLNLTNHIDFKYLPGRLYDTYYDPEGLLSTLPAIATCLLGVMAGLVLRRMDLSEKQKLTWLLAGGAAALALGYLWGLQFPVVKKIWTSSFVLVAGGWSLLLLATFYYLIDVKMWRGWCQPFVWIGMNPITLYLINGVVGTSRIAPRLAGGDVKALLDSTLGAPGGGQLGLALTSLGLIVLLARFLYQRKIFLRV